MISFDLELSKRLRTTEDIESLTDHCQRYIRDRWNGYAPPGSSTIVPLPLSIIDKPTNPWHATTLAILPTMRSPETVQWHKDLVYNTMWSFLCSVQQWNQDIGQPRRIETILMTGLGSGTGGISPRRCAQQMVLAIKHFFLSELGTRPRWDDHELKRRIEEIQVTEGF